jgi:hypothetical protein
MRPMTRAKVKQLKHVVNLFLNDYEHASPKNHVLPNGGTLLVLRFEHLTLKGTKGSKLELQHLYTDSDFQLTDVFYTILGGHTPSIIYG